METVDLRVAIDSCWIAFSAMLVFAMNAGFGLLESGSVRGKNVINSLFRNMFAMAICIAIYWAVGFAFQFGDGSFAGTKGFFLTGSDNSPLANNLYQGDFKSLAGVGVPLALKFLFQAGFASVCATIISGAIAERSKLLTFLVFVALYIPFGYAIAAHWVWGGGWLGAIGFYDFAGSCLVHVVGGIAALMGAFCVGPRLEGDNPILGHNATSRALGCAVLWLGWWGFNGGSTGAMNLAVSHVLLTTNLAAVAGGLGAVSYAWWRYRKTDLSALIDGFLGGLVGITASCPYVSPWASFLIGLVAGILVVYFASYIERYIDDPVHAVAVHLVCGAWGTIALGLFSEGGKFAPGLTTPRAGLLLGGGVQQLGIQFVGLAITLIFTGGLAFTLWKVLGSVLGLRVSKTSEKTGLDTILHQETAYPTQD